MSIYPFLFATCLVVSLSFYLYCSASNSSEELYCMAAYLQGRGIASFGKRLVNQISYAGSRDSSIASPVVLLRRAVHLSVYDKNPEEPVQPTVVPDHVIESDSEKYWAPHPETGVFGPAGDQNLHAGELGFHSLAESVSEDSVLEQKAFFRPLEDLDLERPPPQADLDLQKPPPQPRVS